MQSRHTRALVLGLGLLISVAPFCAAVTETIVLIPGKSSIKWVGKKVTGQHNGTIQLKKGKVILEDGQLKGGEAVIDMSSLRVSDLTDKESNAKLTGHLKSDDFFGVGKFPTATFVITGVNVLTGTPTHEIIGNLTIKGKTAPVTFPATVAIDSKSAQATATIMIDRTLFDVRYGSTKFFDQLGDKAIHDHFTLDVQLVGQR